MSLPTTSKHDGIIPPDYVMITSFSQLPNFDPNLSPLRWTPCAIETFIKHTPETYFNDPYMGPLTQYFLNNKVFLSTVLCKRIPWCHPLHLALEVSNNVKRTHPTLYINTYIHPTSTINWTGHTIIHMRNETPDKYSINLNKLHIKSPDSNKK
jgi:hypothetical protein